MKRAFTRCHRAGDSAVLVFIFLTSIGWQANAQQSVSGEGLHLLQNGFTETGQVFMHPDGDKVLFHGMRGDGWRMYIHDLASSETREVPNLGVVPYFGQFSLDGTEILFGKKGWIWKTPIEGGSISLVHRGNNWKAWESDESILISRGTLGLWRVFVDGQTAMEQVAAVDTSSGAYIYRRPDLLPDGKHVLLTVSMNEPGEGHSIGIVSTETGSLHLLDLAGVNPRYSNSGHILYTVGNTLRAVPFDLDSKSITGSPATIVEGVRVYSNWAALFDISENGTLAYIPGDNEMERVWPTKLVWVNRDGTTNPFETQAERFFWYVKLSPDKTKLAAEVGQELHLFDRTTGTWKVLENEGRTTSPFWAPDGKTLFYTKDTNFGRYDLETDSWTALTDGPETFRAFALAGEDAVGVRYYGMEIWDLAKTSTRAPSNVEFLPDRTGNDRRSPVLSPDGSLLAYVEKISGLDAVFVVPYPAGGEPLLVSAGAAGEAAEPLWGADSSELFYRDAKFMVSIRLEARPELRVRSRTNLFSTDGHAGYLNTFVTSYDYDASTDRFLILEWAVTDPKGSDIYIIRDAFEMLNRLAPAGLSRNRSTDSDR